MAWFLAAADSAVVAAEAGTLGGQIVVPCSRLPGLAVKLVLKSTSTSRRLCTRTPRNRTIELSWSGTGASSQVEQHRDPANAIEVALEPRHALCGK